jgi:hypothetical protein
MGFYRFQAFSLTNSPEPTKTMHYGKPTCNSHSKICK